MVEKYKQQGILPEWKLIPVAVCHVGYNGKEFHVEGCQVEAFTTLGVVELQDLRHLDCMGRQTYQNELLCTGVL